LFFETFTVVVSPHLPPSLLTRFWLTLNVSVPNPKPPRSGSFWSFFPKRDPKLASQVVSSKRVPVPIFHSDKLDDEFSDTSFVLPELGGPNPHNKFDGMEWVDIKGMDDDVLVEISTDLRKYQQHQRQ